MVPSFILQIWLLGLGSVGLITGAAFLAREWSIRSWIWNDALSRSVFSPDFGANPVTWMLAAAVFVVIVALAGAQILRGILPLTGTSEEQVMVPKPASERLLPRPDGSILRVRFYGSETGIPIVCTHGWGLNSNEWNYLIPKLEEGFQIVTWDLPGLGKSTPPTDGDFSLDRLADNLRAVVGLAHGRRTILLGHSIGGMITLTFCRRFPELLESAVSGLILTHTTPTNPVRTTSGAAFLTAIEKPVLIPLMYLTIALSPLVRVVNWLSYLNGSAHLSNRISSFGGKPSWSKVEFATQFQPLASPAVLAKGMLAMMKYDAQSVLPSIPVPVLVVSGDRDSTTKPEASHEMHGKIPDSTLTTLAPAKHLGLIERDSDYAEAVRNYILEILLKNQFHQGQSAAHFTAEDTSQRASAS